MNANQERKTLRDPYSEYSQRYRNREHVEAYYANYNPNSIRALLNRRNLIGWIVAQAEIAAVRRMLGSCHGRTILDVPCGSGKMFPKLASLGFDVLAMDASKEMIMKARSSCSDLAQFVVADLRRLPMDGLSVDIVLCHRILHRIPRQSHREALLEVGRVSRKEVVLYFALEGMLARIILRIQKILKAGDRGRVFFLSRENIKNELSECGWVFTRGTCVIPLVSAGYVVVARKRLQ